MQAAVGKNKPAKSPATDLIKPTSIDGVFLMQRSPVGDARGFFCRMYCNDTMLAAGIDTDIAQINLSHSIEKGTWRGLHYQLAPASETKIVTCMKGRILDFVIDLRFESTTYRQWLDFEITGGGLEAVIVPEGCAHGFLTLEADCQVLYYVSKNYDPTLERGVRFNDPAINLRLPFEPGVVSARDLSHPDLEPAPRLTCQHS